MSNTKREPLLSDEGYRQIINDLADGCGVDTRTPDGAHAYTTMSETARAVREIYEAARAKDAELIQRLVDALDGLVEDRGGIIVAMRRSHKALDAAEAAGFKPSDR